MGEAFPILTGLDDVKSCDWLACPYEEDNNKQHDTGDSDVSGSVSKKTDFRGFSAHIVHDCLEQISMGCARLEDSARKTSTALV
jgi:hypothetical protein